MYYMHTQFSGTSIIYVIFRKANILEDHANTMHVSKFQTSSDGHDIVTRSEIHATVKDDTPMTADVLCLGVTAGLRSCAIMIAGTSRISNRGGPTTSWAPSPG